jgi:hypothetical protein
VNDGQEPGSREQARTAAVMSSTVEQLRLAAQVLDASAAGAPNPQTGTRLTALTFAVSAQADDIQQRAERLTPDLPGPPDEAATEGSVPVDGERPQPGRQGTA